MASAVSFVYIKIPPDEIGLFWPRTKMSESAAHSVDITKERGAHRFLINIRRKGGGYFAGGENVLMNRRSNLSPVVLSNQL